MRGHGPTTGIGPMHDELGDALKDHSLSMGRFVLNRVAVAAAASIFCALPGTALALGLGKLSVHSALGEVLRAEIDVTSLTADEAASLEMKLATPETYRAAGVDFNAVLANTVISLERRSDGRPFLRLKSERPVQEPFVDVILDLAWSSGRLVREYTLLFDPPASRYAPVPAPITAPVAEAPVSTPPRVTPQAAVASSAMSPAPHVEPSESKPRKVAKPASTPLEVEASAPAPVPAPLIREDFARASQNGEKQATGVSVRPGDSLSVIAQRNAVAGVSLDQMLVGLYRSNPQAFLGNNMNRLKTGVVLSLPSPDEAQQVSQPEARRIIVAQSADFAAYRQRLAGTVLPAAVDQPGRQVSGEIEAEVKDRKEAAASAPDKLTLSKGAVGAGSATEDRLAKARAQEDSSTRVAELSKNLDELRRLREKAAPASAPSPTMPEPAPSVLDVASAPLEVAASAASGAEGLASAASHAASMSEAASVAASALAPMAPAPDPAPAVAEPESVGFLESVNLMAVAAGGAGLALLAGGLMFLRARRRAESGETSFLESRLQPDSFFGASGGQRVDTRDASGGPSSMSYSLSQLDAIGDVDPVAEADVYLAYGRDLQAEEILREALRITPDRLAIRTKLLEVYAKRRDTKGFEQLAVQLHGLTQGDGEDWVRAQELGLSIDPENPLYQPGGQPAASHLNVDQAGSDGLGASTIPHSVMPSPSLLGSVVSQAPDSLPMQEGIDLDLDVSASSSMVEVSDSVAPNVADDGHLRPLELPEFGADLPEPPSRAPSEEPVEFGLDLPPIDPSAASPATVPGGLDFQADVAQAPAAAPTFDLGDISLDLNDVPSQDAQADVPLALEEASADPMARKLELADEFRQIGDADGARELLQEVMELAQEPGLKARAQSMLDSLS